MVSYEELKKLIEEQGEYMLIDVRQKDEVTEYGAIPTSHTIPLDELEEALAMTPEERKQRYGVLFDKESRVIFYCRSGGRSSRAVKIAKSKGYKAENYDGSVLEWSEHDENVKAY